METKKVIAEFLQNQPLYSKAEIEKKYFHPDCFYQLTFQFYCPNESSYQTFMLILEPERAVKALGSLSSDRFDNLFNPFQNDKSIKFTHHFSGECQYCKRYKVDFLLNVFSDGPIPDASLTPNYIVRDPSGENKNIPENRLFIKKIGQFPPFEIKPDKEVIKFLQENDKGYYKKALICLSQSFGVGAYAYLRRITENEIIRIIEFLSEVETPDGDKIKNLFQAYKVNKQMTNLIEGVHALLPESLKSLGANPLKVLYSHLSEGIHSDSEETCLTKAIQIDTILKFTIKKLNEEKHELKEIRNALKDLGH